MRMRSIVVSQPDRRSVPSVDAIRSHTVSGETPRCLGGAVAALDPTLGYPPEVHVTAFPVIMMRKVRVKDVSSGGMRRGLGASATARDTLKARGGMLAYVETSWVDATDYRQVFEALPSPVALISIANGEPWLASVSEGFAEQMGVHRAALECRRVADVLRCGPPRRSATPSPKPEVGRPGAHDGSPMPAAIASIRMEVEARPLGARRAADHQGAAASPDPGRGGRDRRTRRDAPLLGGLVFIHDLAKRRDPLWPPSPGERLNLPLETAGAGECPRAGASR